MTKISFFEKRNFRNDNTGSIYNEITYIGIVETFLCRKRKNV